MAALGGYARPIALQNLYNLLQREEEVEMHPLCVEQGIGLTPYNSLARGMLSGKRTAQGGEASARSKSHKMAHDFELFRPSDIAVIEHVKQVTTARGVKPVQVALAWLLSKPGMASPIIGATADAHIDDAVATVISR